MPENAFVPLPGSERTPLAGAEETAQQLDDSERIEVTLITRRRADLPADYVTGPATLTRDQLEAQHGTDPADLARIRDVLGRFGIEVTGADAGARQIYQALLDIMVANEPGMHADLDTEFLHDYRVSLRRTRSLPGDDIERRCRRRTLHRIASCSGCALLRHATGHSAPWRPSARAGLGASERASCTREGR